MFMKRHLRGAKRENVYWETVAGKMSDGKMSDGKISDGKLSTGKLSGHRNFNIMKNEK